MRHPREPQMNPLATALYNLRRRLFGRYVLEDPRPKAKASPYTFFLPAPVEIDALRPGDLAKLVIVSVPRSLNWSGERMWVRVSEITPQGMKGTLENDPCDFPQLPRGSEVRFERHHIIDLLYEDPARAPDIEPPREYFERCLVDDCVLNGQVPVGGLWREEPQEGDGDAHYPDSGWRIRGALRHPTDEDIHAREMSYIALGAVLNRDDSWLHLIDAPVGSAFVRDFSTREYLLDLGELKLEP